MEHLKYVKIALDPYTYTLLREEKGKWREKNGRALDNSDLLLMLIGRSRVLECVETPNDKNLELNKLIEECKKNTANFY